MWIDIDSNGYVLGHDYKRTPRCNIQVEGKIYDCNEECYIIKYVDGNVVQLSPAERKSQTHTVLHKRRAMRKIRNQKLRDSDHKLLDDVTGDKPAWRIYRQQLRDLPDNIDDIHNIDWPIEPKEL